MSPRIGDLPPGSMSASKSGTDSGSPSDQGHGGRLGAGLLAPPGADALSFPGHTGHGSIGSSVGDLSASGPRRAPPTSAEIDAVIAAAIANAPPAPPPMEVGLEASVASARSLTPLMTNILPSAIGSDGRVNLFVGNLPYRVRWQDLKDLFRKAGTVLRADVSLGPDNRSRGYGNVLMGGREDAARAIDRFNGFTWQTRTLEVRPDRLPPEYEPQPHIHHKAMYGFMPPPMGHFGAGAGDASGGWPHARPPPHAHSHGPPFGSNAFSGHIGPAHHASAHGATGAGPFSRGPHMAAQPVPLGASPLAGSLTSGASSGAAGVSGAAWSHGRDTLGPYRGRANQDPSLPRAPSPALNIPRLSGDVPGKRSTSPVPVKLVDEGSEQSYGGGPLGRLPAGPNMYGGKTPDLDASRRHMHHGNVDAPGAVLPIATLNGLANQAKDLGAPNTLVDRVVFVKNLPPSTHWQDLKDLFRPTGVVIRADVATGPDGKSRGFGTVLLASKDDALNAVGMLNGHEIDGRVLNVQTERQTLEDKQIQPIHPIDPFASFGGGKSATWSSTPLPSLASTGSPPTTSNEPFAPLGTSVSSAHSAGHSPSIAARVPWQLNTGTMNQSTTPPKREGSGDEDRPGNRQARHPGPINLPPFPGPGELNPLSPLQTRTLPPMTPSMPGFVFSAFSQPPARPMNHGFLSPGAPFSPGAPVTSPMFGGATPFLNPAPGAPVHHMPQHATGSAALGTPTTQEFPQNASHPTAGPPGSRVHNDYFPPVESVRPNPSPLNAKERLASSTDVNDLSGLTATLALDAVGTASSSPTPSVRGQSGLRHKRTTSNTARAVNSSGSTPPSSGTSSAGRVPITVGGGIAPIGSGANGRNSFDDPRQPLAVGGGSWNLERRASWSEIAGQNVR